jgi:hypothetical protein
MSFFVRQKRALGQYMGHEEDKETANEKGQAGEQKYVLGPIAQAGDPNKDGHGRE